MAKVKESKDEKESRINKAIFYYSSDLRFGASKTPEEELIGNTIDDACHTHGNRKLRALSYVKGLRGRTPELDAQIDISLAAIEAIQ